MLRVELEEQTGGSWRAFENCLSILQAAGALERPEQQEGAAAEVQQQEGAASQPAGAEQLAQQPGQQALEQQEQEQQQQEQEVPELPVQQPAAAAAEQQQETPAPAAAEGAAGTASEGSGTRIGFSALGLVAREVNCANELWMAVVLTHAAVQQLPPPLLAAVLSAGGCGWQEWGVVWPGTRGQGARRHAVLRAGVAPKCGHVCNSSRLHVSTCSSQSLPRSVCRGPPCGQPTQRARE